MGLIHQQCLFFLLLFSQSSHAKFTPTPFVVTQIWIKRPHILYYFLLKMHWEKPPRAFNHYKEGQDFSQENSKNLLLEYRYPCFYLHLNSVDDLWPGPGLLFVCQLLAYSNWDYFHSGISFFFPFMVAAFMEMRSWLKLIKSSFLIFQSLKVQESKHKTNANITSFPLLYHSLSHL